VELLHHALLRLVIRKVQDRSERRGGRGLRVVGTEEERGVGAIERRETLDDVAKLARVARPIVCEQEAQKIGATTASAFLVARRKNASASGAMSSARSRKRGTDTCTTASR